MGDGRQTGVLVRYSGDELARLAYDPGFRPDTWSEDLVRTYRSRHQVLASAEHRGDLSALRCLDLQPEAASGGRRASIRISDDARLLLDFDEQTPDVVTVVGIVRPDTQEVAP
jgi:plasmid maintenance system killer protein